MSGGERGVARTRSAVRRTVGVLAGCLTAPAGLLYLLLAGVPLGAFLLWPRTRPYALGVFASGARRLVEVERRRRTCFFGDRFPEPYGDEGVVRYLAVRSWSGLMCGIVLALLGFGLVLAGLLAGGVVRGSIGTAELLTQLVLGGVLLFLGLQGLFALTAHDARLARECFGPSERELLRRRIDELSLSRAAVVRAVDVERRRIERDLHDGVQQRLVALAMLIGRARRGGGRDPERAAELLGQAHLEAQEVLAELREVAWRVYPSALDSLGLEEALGGVAQRCGLPLRIAYEVAGPLPRPVMTAAYFVVSEAVTNAAKHSAASAVSVRVAGPPGGPLTVRIEDDGWGGADPAGSGLTGLRGRVSALDGVLRIDSPLGGPTTIIAELPCV
ncbi:Oxygen sensor histidine kinase NreB [Streptomyces xanthophaeus]|uniref:sensor histidine kinase n=1 Tax=Streptomyces xanthophaeus TaxID=67385 RepID=UPI00233E8E79|nr:histidine kinase [Streptomyces xanthophaeus]WCD83817.1 Oxygen sensor histidine kinase NreB [Streptomyces xanthophaeus]